MATPRTGRERPAEIVNEVRLVGRMSQEATTRELPSGDVLSSARIIVDRPAAPSPARRCVDALECVAWEPRVRRTLAGWRAGDVVEVHGALRRRFYRSGTAAVSRVEVEVTGARLIRRAATG